MNSILCITSEPALLERVMPLLRGCADPGAEVPHARTVEEAMESLNFALPELAFLSFSDPSIDGFQLLAKILEDPWLHFASIIAWCADHDVNGRLEALRGANIVVSLVDDELERYLPKILDIIVKNRRILFQRGFGEDLLRNLSGSFELGNDILEANCYANLLCNFLYNTDRIDEDGKRGLNIALMELLINAIEHGNCGISYEEKSAWLEDGRLMRDLIAQKSLDPAIGQRRALCEYTITPTRSKFTITDQGAGFDWRSLEKARSAENVQRLHGRGIRMTRRYTQNLRYNEPGNQVTFEIEHDDQCSNTIPALFGQATLTPVSAGTTIFHEGERGDFLYYIVKGRYEVSVAGKVVSELTPDDMLMGEMSFLVNQQRSATVRAMTDGALIRLSKREFVQAIKENPHYALFLARQLAQRLQRRNMQVSNAQESAL